LDIFAANPRFEQTWRKKPMKDRTPAARKRLALKWLYALGFTMHEFKKGSFSDGHERPDVVRHRKAFMTIMHDHILPRLRTYNALEGDDKDYPDMDKIRPPEVSEGGIRYELLFQDEMTVHSNDMTRRAFGQKSSGIGSKHPPKGRGQGTSTASFICETTGVLQCTKPDGSKIYATWYLTIGSLNMLRHIIYSCLLNCAYVMYREES
jgi:hypothetical protein